MKTRNIIFSLFLLLMALPSAAQSSFEVEKSGQGQAVLLLPGFACTSQVFDDLTVELSKNYEVHAFTFAGFGEVAPISFPWLPQIKSDIERYVEENRLEKPIIIGHSLGGTLGLWLASEPSAYSSLIIIDALPAMGALMIPDYNSDAIVYDNPQNAQMLAMDNAAFREMANQTATYMTTQVEKQKVIADWIAQTDRKTYVYGYTDLLKLDLRDSLANIDIPVHILAATVPYGKETVETNYREQYKHLRDYTLTFAEGSGHFIMYDQPEWFITEMKSSLNINE